jgi:hypothetical protein
MLPLSRHDSSVPLRTMCVFCAPFASRMQLRGIPVSVPGLARHAVPLTPSIAASLSWPSCAAEHAFSAKIPHAGRTNPLPVARYCFKSFSRNAYGSPRKCCKQKTYDPTKPFRCNTYKKQGVGAPPFRNSSLITRHSSLATAVKFFAFTLLRTLLHFSALAQNSTRFFPIASALLFKNTGGWGMPYILTSLPPYFITARNGNALPAAMGAAAKRAHRLQERRSCPALNQLSGGGGGGASGPPSV